MWLKNFEKFFTKYIDILAFGRYKISEMKSQTRRENFPFGAVKSSSGQGKRGNGATMSRSIQSGVVPLAFAKLNKSYLIVRYIPNGEIPARLAEFGFVRNALIIPQQRVFGGMTVRIGGTKFALSKSAARHILVRDAEE